MRGLPCCTAMAYGFLLNSSPTICRSHSVKSRYLKLPHNFGTLGKRQVRWGLLKLHHFCPCRLDLLRIFLVVLLATLMMLLDSLCGSHCSLDSSHLHSTKPSNVKKNEKILSSLSITLRRGNKRIWLLLAFYRTVVLSGALSFCCLPDTLLSSFGGTIVTLFENY